MELNTVGRSGLQVTPIGLGCNNFGSRIDEQASRRVVGAALDAGITFFDSADIYGHGASEEYLGAALRSRRDEVVIATKFSSKMDEGPYWSGASRKYLLRACEDSLRRLGTDHIDLYYQHWPDPRTPIEETLDALDDLVRAGKVRYVACSNFAGWQVVEAEHVARAGGRTRFVACQAEWSVLQRGVEAELVPACTASGVGVVPYFPLSRGLLTGKYSRHEPPPAGTRLAAPGALERVGTDQAFDAVDRLADVGRRIGRTLLEVAIGWLAHQPCVPSVLVGATTPEQVEANVAAAQVALSPEDLRAISEASAGT